jgi:CRP-like cAMP-binding protein
LLRRGRSFALALGLNFDHLIEVAHRVTRGGGYFMDEVATIFSFNNWFGHFSYLLIAISYWLTDIFWLRLMAVVGLSFEILYFWHSGGDLRTGIGWDLIFILINAYQLFRLLRDRLSLRLPEADRDLLRSVLAGLDDSQIARLLAAGAFCDLPGGTTLAVEDEPLEKIYFICSGRVGVTIAGREVSHLERGNFVGEVAFLTEKPATATVIAEGKVRALVFERGKLSQFFKNETEVAGLIYQLLGRELAQKIKVSNQLISPASSLA